MRQSNDNIYMRNIVNRIFELIEEYDNGYQKIVEQLKLSDVSIVYTWKREEYFPSTENLIKMSELFNCSLDYLLCRTDDYGRCAIKQVSKFYDRVEELIKKNKCKKYKLEEDKICSSNNLFKWKNGANPKIETVIKLADYFNVTIDYLLGRE